jgi:Dyp-type peroxidase family
MMTLDLSRPLSWQHAHLAASPGAAAELAMLNDLQGNILKGHGRRCTSNLFLRFDPGKKAAACAFLTSFADSLTSALEQLIATENFKKGGPGGGDFHALMLSASGYDALGQGESKPAGAAFRSGMKNRAALRDPDVDKWEQPFREEVHAMILIAADDDAKRNAARDRLRDMAAASGGAVALLNPAFGEDGSALFNDDGNGVEHFGYVDGRSQPLALLEQLYEEEALNGGIKHWNPRIPLSQLLVRCPGGKLEVSCGSYFVFRKLEQNVRAFKEREETLAGAFRERFNLRKEDIEERLGATVVGRFENGTPATLFGAEQPPIAKGPVGVPNDFNYASDPAGLRCPFASHIRKTNPRSDTEDSLSHLMARRGIPYGARKGVVDHVLRGDAAQPETGVGLLFMAYQSSLENQFEFTQVKWANNVAFARPRQKDDPEERTGIDPLIGQPSGPSGQHWPAAYGMSESDGANEDTFSGFVKMLGGEYFFAPSISFVKSLA